MGMAQLKRRENLLSLYMQGILTCIPLTLCMSYQQTLRIIDKLSEDHDVKVIFWADELIELVDKPPERVSLHGLQV